MMAVKIRARVEKVLRRKKPRNNGVQVTGERAGRRWWWRVLNCTHGAGTTVGVPFSTQRAAIVQGRDLARRLQCELFVRGRNGRIRLKDSFGRDPLNVKG